LHGGEERRGVERRGAPTERAALYDMGMAGKGKKLREKGKL
jgi:hypothetical protein